jgi:hypothetical protein
MNHLSQSSSPSYGTWAQVNGETLVGKAHIARLNELTESPVTEWTSSMPDDTALPILKRKGSRAITTVSSQRKIIYDIQVNPYCPKCQTQHSKLAAKEVESSEFHQDMWNHYLRLGFVLAYTP